MHRITRSLIACLVLAVGLVLGSPGIAHAEPAATASETENLADGQTVTVDYTGFPANATIAVVQCTAAPPEADTECDSERFELGTADEAGAGTVQFTVHTGTIGADGTVCDAAENNDCAIVVTDFPVTVSAVVPINFAPTDSPEEEEPTTTTPPDEEPDEETAAAEDDDDGSLAVVLIVLGVVVAAAVGAAVVVARRRRS